MTKAHARIIYALHTAHLYHSHIQMCTHTQNTQDALPYIPAYNVLIHIIRTLYFRKQNQVKLIYPSDNTHNKI